MLPFTRILQYGNTAPSPDAYKVLFGLKDFHSTADIVDRSGNAIPVNNANSIGVGSDAYGTYMNFTGTNTQWINCKSTKLDIGTNCELYYKISGLTYYGGQFGIMLMDSRPLNTNGNYLLFAYSSTKPAPFYGITNVNLKGDVTATTPFPTDQTVPYELRLRMLKTGTYLYLNNVLISTNPEPLNVVNQNWTIGRNAFSSQAATPFLTAKIYQFEIRQLTNQ